MFSVHAFVRKDGQLKQLPLAFAVMSRRRRCDYESVLRAIVDALPQRPAVQAVVADFERAVWAAVQTVLPGVTQRGCNFHYTQAVWRNVQVVGLQTAFASDDTIHRVIRMTMALGFLPANVIRDVFEELTTSVTTGRLVETTWNTSAATGSTALCGRRRRGQSSASPSAPTMTARAGTDD